MSYRIRTLNHTSRSCRHDRSQGIRQLHRVRSAARSFLLSTTAKPPLGNPLPDSALELAKFGFPVFPLVPRRKQPLTTHGVNDATIDPNQVRGWWTDRPDANIGVAMGDGYVVIDVDGPAGEASLAEIEKEHGALPSTAVARTGRGRHLYFKTLESFRNRVGALGPGLDVRSKGAYVVAPPSVHPSGVQYSWASNHPPAELPDSFARLMQAQKVELRQATADCLSSSPSSLIGMDSAYGRQGLEYECKALAACAEGGRNDALNRAAFAAGQLLAGGELRDEPDAIERLLRAADACGLLDDDGENACRNTIASGMRAGRLELRAAPSDPSAQTGKRENRGWRVRNLIDLAANPPGPPSVLQIFYGDGARHVLSGEPESFKSWIALIASAEQIEAGHFVLWIDTDSMGAGPLLERLESLGLDRSAIRERFGYIAPDGPQGAEDVRCVAAVIADRRPSVVVIDSFEATLSLFGAQTNTEVEDFMRQVIQPLRASDSAVILIDHLAKARESRGMFSIGAQRKVAAVEVHLEAKVVQPFGRAAPAR